MILSYLRELELPEPRRKVLLDRPLVSRARGGLEVGLRGEPLLGELDERGLDRGDALAASDAAHDLAACVFGLSGRGVPTLPALLAVRVAIAPRG